jgi:hypothetical protein
MLFVHQEVWLGTPAPFHFVHLRAGCMPVVQHNREETTVVGSLPAVTAGEWLVADGWWVRDKEHGLQFKAAMMKTVPPTTWFGNSRPWQLDLV